MRLCSTLGVAMGTFPEVSTALFRLWCSVNLLMPRCSSPRQSVSHTSLASGLCSTFLLVPHIATQASKLSLRFRSLGTVSLFLCFSVGFRHDFAHFSEQGTQHERPHVFSTRSVSRLVFHTSMALEMCPKPNSSFDFSAMFQQWPFLGSQCLSLYESMQTRFLSWFLTSFCDSGFNGQLWADLRCHWPLHSPSKEDSNTG